MTAYDDGLNFLPMLAQSSPMNRNKIYSRRGGPMTTANTTVKHSNHAMVKNNLPPICYNGNYEGDSSMFSNGGDSTNNTNGNIISSVPNNRLDLIETDSDTEYKRELEHYRGPLSSEEAYSQPRRLWQQYKTRLTADARVQKLIFIGDLLQQNYYFQRVCEVLRLSLALSLYIMRWLLITLMNICNWSRAFLRSRLFLRQAARRLLWSMTVAKCGDASFFGLIVLATPLLFAVSVCGFLLSTYGSVKVWLLRICDFINERVFYIF